VLEHHKLLLRSRQSISKSRKLLLAAKRLRSKLASHA
jgi:hypothetical protein